MARATRNGGNAKIFSAYRLDREQLAALGQLARQRGTNTSEIVREILQTAIQLQPYYNTAASAGQQKQEGRS